jgi:major intracellular serine protease
MSLKKNPIIKLRDENLSSIYAYPIGIIDTNVQIMWKRGIKGQNINIAVLDTGIMDHSDLRNNVIYRKSFSGNITDSHGTHVAGTIAGNPSSDGHGVYGVAPRANLLDIQMLDENGGSEIDFLKAVKTAINLGAHIINASIGSQNKNKNLKNAVKLAKKSGVIVVCAAGNEGLNSFSYPAAYEECVSVSNVDVFKNLRNPSSTANKYVDICAHGTEIISTDKNDGYAVYSGTSMATPIVSGVLALYIQYLLTKNPNLSKKEIAKRALSMLYRNVVDLGIPGKDESYGVGKIKYNPHVRTRFDGELKDYLYFVGDKLA